MAARRARAWPSSWRTRSRVRPSSAPIASSVHGSPSKPNRSSRIRRSRCGQRVERLADSLPAQRLLGLVERVRSLAVGEQIAELALVVGADGLVQRHGRLSGAERLLEMLHRDAGRLRELLARGFAAQLDLEPATLPGRASAGARRRAPARGSSAHGSRRPAEPTGGSTRWRTSRTCSRAASRTSRPRGSGRACPPGSDRGTGRPGPGSPWRSTRRDAGWTRSCGASREVALLDALRERDLLGCGEQLVAPDVGEEELQRVSGAEHRLGGRPSASGSSRRTRRGTKRHGPPPRGRSPRARV